MSASGEPRRKDLLQDAPLLLLYAEALLRYRGWTRGAYARDRHGHPVNPTSARAVRFCATGALIRADFELHGEPFEEADEEGITGSPTFTLALAHLSVACAELLGRYLAVARAKEARSISQSLDLRFLQLPDACNEIAGLRRESISELYELAIRIAEHALVERRRRRQPAKKSPAKRRSRLERDAE